MPSIIREDAGVACVERPDETECEPHDRNDLEQREGHDDEKRLCDIPCAAEQRAPEGNRGPGRDCVGKCLFFEELTGVLRRRIESGEEVAAPFASDSRKCDSTSAMISVRSASDSAARPARSCRR